MRKYKTLRGYRMSNTTPIVEAAFATPIYSTSTEAYLTLNEYLIKKHLNRVQPNFEGNVTTRDHYLLEDEKLNDMKDWFQYNINHFVHEILGIKKTLKFYITQSWMNYNYPGTSHHSHFHRNSFISGTYYLKGDAPIIFEKQMDWTQHFEFDFEKPTIFSGEQFHVSPKPGTMLLFPSNLRHRVAPNHSDDMRVSIAFNVFFKGEIQGEKDSLTRLTI